MTTWENTFSYTKGPTKITYTYRLEQILKKLDKDSNYVAFQLLHLAEKSCDITNILNISMIDVSKSDYSFDVTIENTDAKYKKAKVETMRIEKFCTSYYGKHLDSGEVYQFAKLYNAMKGVNRPEEELDGSHIEIPKFRYNPKDVRSTFISLTTKTYPNPHEDEVLEFLPELEKDNIGNYYKIIGDSKTPETMFCCHLDTADRIQKDVVLLNFIEEDETGKYTPEEYILTDGSSILGAYYKAGTAVMLYLMAHGVPGLYYFFIGEERGGIGSRALAAQFFDMDYLQNVKRCTAFDRRDYHSVITRQGGTVCCSDEFGNALCRELNAHGLNLTLDTTGVFTDSKSFIDDIPECVNISVGYFHEHSSNEYQNMTYLQLLAEASSKINWDALPTVRRVGMDQEVIRRYSPIVKEIRKSSFICDVKVTGSPAGIFITCDLEFGSINGIHSTLSKLSALLAKHNIDKSVVFDDTLIKIQLK